MSRFNVDASPQPVQIAGTNPLAAPLLFAQARRLAAVLAEAFSIAASLVEARALALSLAEAHALAKPLAKAYSLALLFAQARPLAASPEFASPPFSPFAGFREALTHGCFRVPHCFP